MKTHIDTYLRIILESAQKKTVMNVSEPTDRLGIDVIGTLAFGYEFNTQTNAANRAVYQFVTGLGYRGNVYMQWPILKMLETAVKILNLRKMVRFMSIIRTIINTRMAQGKDAHNDLYSMIMNNLVIEDQENNFETGEIWPESIFLFSAGAYTDFKTPGRIYAYECSHVQLLTNVVGGLTASTTISATLFYLAKNPKCYAAVASEIRSTFTSESEICMGQQLTSCKYLRACIDESLRMSPPFLPVSWREQDANEAGPFVVDGKVIPRGTQVGISPYAIMHDEKVFPDPFTYKPERWFESTGTEDGSDAKKPHPGLRKSFIPFLLGDRGCLGKTMAYAKTSLVLARILWFYDFESAPGKDGLVGGGSGEKGKPGSPDEYVLGDIVTTEHDGPNLVFTTRGDAWKELQQTKTST